MNRPTASVPRRYRLPSEDDDAFAPVHQSCTTLSSTTSSNRGIKRSRLSSDDVFFRPRARLSSDCTPQFPRVRLPSDCDSSSVLYTRHRRFRGRKNRPLLRPPRDSSSIQLSISQYTADDTPDPAFTTPHSRPPTHRSSEMSNSSRENYCKMFKHPPKVTQTPYAWTSTSISDVTHSVPMSDESIADVRMRLFHQMSSSGSDSFYPNSLLISTPTAVPVTSSPTKADIMPNLAQSILAEELKSDSGIATLHSFDGQECFSDYHRDFGEKLVDVMVKILNTVDQHQLLCYPVRDSIPDDLQNITNIFSHTDNISPPTSSPVSEVTGYTTPSPTSFTGISSLSRDIISPLDISPVLPSVHALSWTPMSSTTSSTKKSAKCKICHKTLSSSAVLRVHMRIHTGERPFVCPYCFKDFSDRTSFRRHKWIHTGKPFTCELCKKGYASKDELCYHQMNYH